MYKRMRPALRTLGKAVVATPPAVGTVLVLDHILLSRRGAFQDTSAPSIRPNGKSCLIVGGGVVAVSSAFFLNRKGFKVTLLEANQEVGFGTSNVNAGTMRISKSITSMTFNRVMNSLMCALIPGEFGSIYRFDIGTLAFDVQFWRWAFRAVLNSLNTSLQDRVTSYMSQINLVALATVQSVATYSGIAADDYAVAFGSLTVQCTAEAALKVQSRSKDYAAKGINHHVYTTAETLENEPALKSVAHRIYGSDFTPDDFVGDCGVFTRMVSNFCESQGVQIIKNAKAIRLEWQAEGSASNVTAVISDDGRRFDDFEHVVLCAGCGSANLARQLGIYLPIYPTKGYALDIRASEFGQQLQSTGNIVFEPLDMFMTQFLGANKNEHRIRFTSGAEFAGWDEQKKSKSVLNSLRRRAETLFPHVPAAAWDSADVHVGARPWSVDDLPIVGGTAFSNVWVNVGHGHTGWRLACPTAELLSSLMTGTDCPSRLDPQMLSLTRFQSLWRH